MSGSAGGGRGPSLDGDPQAPAPCDMVGAAWPEMLGVFAVMGACAAGALTLRDPGKARAPEGVCQEILRRYAEARLRQADARPNASTMATHRAAVDDRAEVSRRFARCPEEVGAARAECALRAGGADEIERCLQ